MSEFKEVVKESVEEEKQETVNFQNVSLLKNKKILLGIVIALVFILVVVGFYFSSPKKEDILSVAKATFSGYDGYGKLELNTAEIQSFAGQAVAKQVNLNLEKYDNALSVLFDITNPAAVKFSTLYQKLNIKASKQENLKNGDVITVSVTFDGDEKLAPVQLTKKEFEVTGLQSVEVIKASEVLKEHPVKFEGIDGAGYLADHKYFTLEKEDSTLFNGDLVKLTFSQEFLQKNTLKEGVIIEEKETEVKVEGLKSINAIQGLNTLADNFEAMAKEYEANVYGSTKREVTELNHIIIKVQPSHSFFDKDVKAKLSFKKLYKVLTKYTYFSDEEEYIWLGYEDVPLDDDTVRKHDIQKHEKRSKAIGKTIEDILSIAKKDGYEMYEIKE